MGLREYHEKRDFTRTSEPRGGKRKSSGRSYVIQKHAASRLHYDFRLEHAGTLLSWAVPKGPSLDPADKRLAVQVEDHPVEYGKFEGIIPRGEYGGGSVLVWDRGRWKPDGDVDAGLRAGKLDFELEGRKLGGAWRLIRLEPRAGEEDKNWLLIKRRDSAARSGRKPITELRPESVQSGKRIEDIGPRARVWSSNRTSSAKSGAAAKRTVPARRSGATKRAVAAKRSAAPRRAAQENTSPRPRATSAPRRTEPRPATKGERRSGPSALVARSTRRSLASLARGLTGAKRAPLPGFVPVQLATLVAAAPDGAQWIHEVKYDGYRMLAELDTGRVRWLSRNGIDRSRNAASLSPAFAALGARSALIDGELCVLDERGISRFQKLQQALGGEGAGTLTYFAFDLLHLDGYDVRACKLMERKRLLEALLARTPPRSGVRFGAHFAGRGPEFLRSACGHDLEGVVSKLADAPYRSGRSRDWLKSKCGQRQELVVVGFTEPQGARADLGALVLAVNDAHGLRFAGRVGTGFDQAMLKRLRHTLEPLRVERPPLAHPLGAAERRGVVWVKPRVVVDVAFTDWTADGRLRHPSFVGSSRVDLQACKLEYSIVSPK